MNVAQVAAAATAYVIWGWRGLVIELWVNALGIVAGETIAKRRVDRSPILPNGRPRG